MTQHTLRQGQAEAWVLRVLDQLAKDRDLLGQETWRQTQRCQELQEANERQRSELYEMGGRLRGYRAGSIVEPPLGPEALLQEYYSPTRKRLWYSDGKLKSTWMGLEEQTQILDDYEQILIKHPEATNLQTQDRRSLSGGMAAAAALGLSGLPTEPSTRTRRHEHTE